MSDCVTIFLFLFLHYCRKSYRPMIGYNERETKTAGRRNLGGNRLMPLWNTVELDFAYTCKPHGGFLGLVWCLCLPCLILLWPTIPKAQGFISVVTPSFAVVYLVICQQNTNKIQWLQHVCLPVASYSLFARRPTRLKHITKITSVWLNPFLRAGTLQCVNHFKQ